MHTQAGLERLTAFTDAVVAIAITLLVLPLVDIPADRGDESVATLLRDHLGELGAFLLSFVVIAQLWRIHHQLFEHVGGYDRVLVRITLVWLLTVVFLPFPTALLGHGQDRGTTTLYIGTLLLGSLSLTVSAEWVSRHPDLQRLTDDDGTPTPVPRAGWATSILMAVALLIAAALPAVGMLAMLLLLLAPSLDALLARRLRQPAGRG